MSQHLSPELADRFRRRTLAKAELIAADRHLASCLECRQLLADEDAVSRQIDSLRTDLCASLQPGHAEYMQIEAYVDQKLAEEERHALDLHFKSCSQCAEELRDLQAFKVQLDEGQPVTSTNLETAARSSLLSKLFLTFRGSRSSRRRWALAACAVIALAVGIGFLWIWQHKTNTAVHKPPTPPAPVPETGKDLEQSMAFRRTALATPSVAQANCSYLPPKLLSIVTHAFKTQHIETPHDLDELAVRRGGHDAFPLLSPVKTFVYNTRPVFQWEAIPNADGYRVLVSDLDGNSVESSQVLRDTSWKSAVALRRDEVYLWRVVTIRDDGEVKESVFDLVQGRFRVLDKTQSRQLQQLKRTHPQEHFARGILLAHAGVLEDAMEEFRAVQPSDPNYQLAKKFERDLIVRQKTGSGQ